jgi:hypothetical protein
MSVLHPRNSEVHPPTHSERNSKRSSSKRSRAINIRYFFITDLIDKGNIEIKYCPTKLMIGDFFTKPLQGKQFAYFRDLILGKRSFSPTEIDGLVGWHFCCLGVQRCEKYCSPVASKSDLNCRYHMSAAINIL